MVNNSTNINKAITNISPKESLNSDGQQFHQNQKAITNISPKESLNSDGQHFYKYQQNKQ